MPKTSDIILGGKFMGLFISDNGNGKTVAAASFPGPIKFWDFDGRMQPVKLFYPTRTDIDYELIGMEEQRPNMSIGYPGCIGFMDFCKQFEELQDRCDYATIVLDSLTALTACAVAYQLGIKGAGKGKKLAGGIQVPTWDEFNGETSVVQQILEISKILPCNVIMTAHPIDKSVDAGGGTLKKARSIAAYGTKTPSLVPIYFNEIYQFGVEPPDNPGGSPKRFVITAPDGKNMAKTALPIPTRIDITNAPLYPIIKRHLEAHNIKLMEAAAAKSL